MLREFAELDAGLISCERHVDGHSDRRIERERGRARAGKGDLLLDGRHGGHVTAAPPASATSRAASSAT